MCCTSQNKRQQHQQVSASNIARCCLVATCSTAIFNQLRGAVFSRVKLHRAEKQPRPACGARD
jgi:hypothetical protein